MKPFSFSLLVAAVSILACNNKKPKAMTITSDDGKSKVSVAVNSAAAVSNDMPKKIDELKKLTPLTTDQLKTMLSEQQSKLIGPPLLIYFSTFSFFPILVNAEIAFSKCFCSCAALNCTRMRAWPFGTTGKKNPIT